MAFVDNVQNSRLEKHSHQKNSTNSMRGKNTPISENIQRRCDHHKNKIRYRSTYTNNRKYRLCQQGMYQNMLNQWS